MGLDVSISLIIGVPLLDLGKLETKRQTVAFTDHLGRPTGKNGESRQVFFRVKNQTRYLVGNNDKWLQSGYEGERGRIDFTYEDFPLGGDDWYHCSDYEDNKPEDVVIGLSVESVEGPGIAGFEAFKKATFDDIGRTEVRVKQELEKQFGYSGPVYAFVMALYSY